MWLELSFWVCSFQCLFGDTLVQANFSLDCPGATYWELQSYMCVVTLMQDLEVCGANLQLTEAGCQQCGEA